MMTHFKKNCKKHRHVSIGHSCINKQRKYPNGRSNISGMHFHCILFNKYHLGYFGKVSIQYFHKFRNKFYCPTININKLWSLVPKDVKEKASKDNVPLVNVTQYRDFKVLGKGILLKNQPMVVKAKVVSKNAKKNIKEVGGTIVFTT